VLVQHLLGSKSSEPSDATTQVNSCNHLNTCLLPSRSALHARFLRTLAWPVCLNAPTFYVHTRSWILRIHWQHVHGKWMTEHHFAYPCAYIKWGTCWRYFSLRHSELCAYFERLDLCSFRCPTESFPARCAYTLLRSFEWIFTLFYASQYGSLNQKSTAVMASNKRPRLDDPEDSAPPTSTVAATGKSRLTKACMLSSSFHHDQS